MFETQRDKLPKTPAPTASLGLIARIVLPQRWRSEREPVFWTRGPGGGMEGAVGTFAGDNVRHTLVTRLGWPDFVVALAEDVVAVVGGLLVVSRV